MNTDYRTPTSFYNDIRTARLQRRLGDSGIAALTFLWCYTALYKAEGILADMDDEDIEFAAKWNGEKGKLVPTLLELEYLDQLQDGTYAVHEWAETNSWAADADNRSDKARLSNMAKNYPELYEELVAQGYTGIDRASYASLTAEYNRQGILRSSSRSLRIANESLTPTPKPSPAPVPTPDLEPSLKEDVVVRESSASSSSPEATQPRQRKHSKKGKNPSSQKETRENLQTTITFEASENPENLKTPEPSIKAENMENPEILETTENPTTTEAATLAGIFMEWNARLGALGFPKVAKVTPYRKGAFMARLRCSQERSLLAWWVALFGKIAASDFMRESAAQKANWLTIDWVLNEHNMMKIIEGKYDSERPVIAEIHHKQKVVQRVISSTESGSVPVDCTPAAKGIPEDKLHEMNAFLASIGKSPITNDEPQSTTQLAEVLEAEYSDDALPAEEEPKYTDEQVSEMYVGFEEELASIKAEMEAFEREKGDDDYYDRQ